MQHGSGAVPGGHGADASGDRVPDQIIIWCDLNDEQDLIEKSLLAEGLSFSSVYGSLTDEEAERRLDEWRDGKTYALIGKPVMLGQGMNLQQANTAIFVGVSYKFDQTIQACHRIQRFGQERACSVTIIYAETESEVRDVLERKWKEHDRLTDTMSDVIREFGLNSTAISAALTRSMGVDRVEESGDEWTIALNDCTLETRDHMDAESIDLIVTSIPFSNHYEYTPSYNDFGHTDDNLHFWQQMDYLTPELWRILKPGRIYACHVKDRIQFGAVTGAGVPTVSPFHQEATVHGLKHGFDYLGMITVTTDVVRENNQTYRLGYTEMRKDGTKMGVGSPEYILLFHKPQTDRAKGYADVRVSKEVRDYSLARWQIDAAADWRSSGNRLLSPDELALLAPDVRSKLFKTQSRGNVYDFDAHVATGEALAAKNALPSTFKSLDPGSWRPDVWDDVNRMLTLNGEQSRRALEFHICPLQFDIVDRLIERYSNRGELVYDPFGGLGTVPLRARKLGRLGRASELNPTSFRDAVMYQRELDNEQATPSLFDLLELEDTAA
ncbi:DNA methyltransferase [Microbacterium jejuense]|uniref:DNA methyltransferase n=1 Tax=Microbacterium jejuense TaxID=1263637 RepID=UPI0031EB3C8C